MSQVESEELISSEDKGAQDERLVPVSEAIRYRRRAQTAEKKLAALDEELAKAKSQSELLAEKLNHVEVEQKLFAKLASAGASDIETAVLLAKAKIEASDEADVDTVIEQLKKEKQYLFAESGLGVQISRTAGAKQKGPSNQNVLERAARKAANSGNRTDLQEYLKLRRNFI